MLRLRDFSPAAAIRSSSRRSPASSGWTARCPKPRSRAPGSRWPATPAGSRPTGSTCSARPRSPISTRSQERAAARPAASSSASTCPASSSPRGRRSRRSCSSWPARGACRCSGRKLKTAEFYRRIKPIVEEAFAPRTTLHGSLADVYGVGLLFIGRSGIGKSECVLDLVERGHRLVADDVVQVTRRGNDVLIGRGHELAAHHMEIRGIGLIDIPALFGVRAVRQQKRIEVVVQLEDWETAKDTDRTGLAREETMILDVPVPRVVVPLNPGKNITVISEVVAMMHLLRYSGVDVAAAFNDRLIKRMKEQRGVREYLQEDYE